MCLIKNRPLSLLLTVAVLAIAAWMMLQSAPLATNADDGDASSSDESEELNVSPKARSRPVPVKNTPHLEPPSTTQTRDAPPPPTPPPPQHFSQGTNQNDNSVHGTSFLRSTVREYTETIQERNTRIEQDIQTCRTAATNAGLWNNAWDDNPVILMFIANSGVIPVSGTPKSGYTVSNLRVWLHQIRADEYPWLDRQQGQHGAWSPHYSVYAERLDACR